MSVVEIVPEVKKLDERKTKAFTAIVNFVTDLVSVYGGGNKTSPLALYTRLVVNHIKFTETDRIDSALQGFNAFFDAHGASVIKCEWDRIPENTRIRYGQSDRIYLEIQKYIYQSRSNPGTLNAIREHLLTIQAILRPTDTSVLVQELEKMSAASNNAQLAPPSDFKAALNIDENTNEGRFIAGIMNKTKDALEGFDTSNPATALVGLAQSGVVQELIGGLQGGVSGGQLDMGKLLATMTGALQGLMPKQVPNPSPAATSQPPPQSQS